MSQTYFEAENLIYKMCLFLRGTYFVSFIKKKLWFKIGKAIKQKEKHGSLAAMYLTVFLSDLGQGKILLLANFIEFSLQNKTHRTLLT